MDEGPSPLNARVPMTVIGGFLGAGKTTLLNRVLCESHGVRYGVLVNDFGDLAVDATLVSSHGGDTVSFANGCVCCTLGDGLMQAVDRLLEGEAPPQHFIVEASGVSDPRAIADQATLHPRLTRDLTIVLADAGSVMTRHADPRLEDTVQRQLRAADLVVLNRCDEVTPERRRELEDWLRGFGAAPILPTVNADIPLELLRTTAALDASDAVHRPSTHALHQHAPAQTFRSVSVPLPDPVDTDALRDALAALPASVLRAKGFVRTTHAPGSHALVQLTGRRVSITDFRAQPDLAPAIVFIGLADLPAAGQLAAILSGAPAPVR